MPPRWMVEECSREFGQIAGPSLPFADPPTKENMITKRSAVNPTKPYGINVSEAPAFWSQGILWTILATAEQTGGSYSLMEELCPKDDGPPPHTHDQDEVIYVVEGELTMIAGAERIRAKAGSARIYSCPIAFTVSESIREEAAFSTFTCVAGSNV